MSWLAAAPGAPRRPDRAWVYVVRRPIAQTTFEMPATVGSHLGGPTPWRIGRTQKTQKPATHWVAGFGVAVKLLVRA